MFEVHRQNHGVCTQCPQCAAGRQSVSETDAAETGRLRLVGAFIQTRYGVIAPNLRWQPGVTPQQTPDIAFCDKVSNKKQNCTRNMVYGLIISHSIPMASGGFARSGADPNQDWPCTSLGGFRPQRPGPLVSHYTICHCILDKRWLLRKLAEKLKSLLNIVEKSPFCISRVVRQELIRKWAHLYFFFGVMFLWDVLYQKLLKSVEFFKQSY